MVIVITGIRIRARCRCVCGSSRYGDSVRVKREELAGEARRRRARPAATGRRWSGLPPPLWLLRRRRLQERGKELCPCEGVAVRV